MAVSDELLDILLQEVAIVTFKKRTTGEIRTMPCTRNLSLVPQDMLPKGNDRQRNPDIIKVYSLDRDSWRSFHKQDVIDIKRVNENGQTNDSGRTVS